MNTDRSDIYRDGFTGTTRFWEVGTRNRSLTLDEVVRRCLPVLEGGGVSIGAGVGYESELFHVEPLASLRLVRGKRLIILREVIEGKASRVRYVVLETLGDVTKFIIVVDGPVDEPLRDALADIFWGALKTAQW